MNAASKQSGNAMDIQSMGRQLLGSHDLVDSPIQSLLPLGLALVEGGSLFSEFNPSMDQGADLGALFDGGETAGPNLHTRLRYIRDLCSASGYGLQERALRSNRPSTESSNDAVETPGERAWANLIATHASSRDEKCIEEVARLLDDVLEAMIRIVANLRGLASGLSWGSWSEVDRHICHIRDHFDYAEDMVLDCIQPAKEEMIADHSTAMGTKSP
jgi:hypothetical protein